MRKLNKFKKIISLSMAIATIATMSVASMSVSAYESTVHYKKGPTKSYGSDKYFYDKQWKDSKKNVHEDWFFIENEWYRCVSFYNNWATNRAQTMGIARDTTVSANVETAVSGVLGVSGKILSSEISGSISKNRGITYTSSSNTTYDLSKYRRGRDYRIGAKAWIGKYEVRYYKNHNFMKKYKTYAIDLKDDYCIDLVHRESIE